MLATIFPTMPFPVNYWHAQNIYYTILQHEFPSIAARGDSASRLWKERFLELGERLQISVPALVPRAEMRMAG